MSNPEKDDKDLELDSPHAASDENELSSAIFGVNEHDILWIDAVSDGSVVGNPDVADWTQAPTGDAGAQQVTERWIATSDSATGDEALFEDGLALTSIDGLPW